MKLRNCTALLLFSYLLAACNQAQSPTSAAKTPPLDKVATINGKPLTRPEFQGYVENIERQSNRRVLLVERPQLLDQFIGMRLGAEQAEKLGLDKDPKVAEQLSIARTLVLSDAALQHYLDEHPVKEEELRPYYDAEVAKLPPEYKTSQILVDNPGTAKELIEKLKKGADFAKLAKEKSKDSSKVTGGDIGWVVPQAMLEEYADAVFKLNVGEITQEPVKTRFGWHIIRLDDVRAQTVVGGFDAVKDKVSVMLKRQRINTYLEGLRKAATIEKDPRGPNPLMPNSTTELVPTPTDTMPPELSPHPTEPGSKSNP